MQKTFHPVYKIERKQQQQQQQQKIELKMLTGNFQSEMNYFELIGIGKEAGDRVRVGEGSAVSSLRSHEITLICCKFALPSF